MAGASQPYIASSKYPEVLWDPAIEKWYHMKENTHAHFRMTPRVVRYGAWLAVVIPVGLYYAIKAGQVRDYLNRLKGRLVVVLSLERFSSAVNLLTSCEKQDKWNSTDCTVGAKWWNKKRIAF